MAYDPGKETALVDGLLAQRLEHFGQFGIVGLPQLIAIEVQEGRKRCGCGPLVAIDELLVLSDEEPIRGGLLLDALVGVFTKNGLLWLERRPKGIGALSARPQAPRRPEGRVCEVP